MIRSALPIGLFTAPRAGNLAVTLAIAGAWLAGTPAQAQVSPAAPQPPPAPATTQAGDQAPPTLWERSNLFGDMGGFRTFLSDHGVSLGLSDTNEVLGNLTGGVHTGADYDGLTEFSVGVDTAKAFGWQGGTFNISGLQIRGRDLSADNLFTLQTASGIEASDTTRLWELWYQQAFAGGTADVKLGLQSIDQEFMTSSGSSLFINTAMGWPVLPSQDLYAGGPAYPLSSLGIRLRLQPGGPWTALGGVFQDNPPGGPFNADSQLLGSTRWGGNFNLRTGALFIAEVQYALNPPPSGDATPKGLPGTYKLGFWYDTASFPSPQFDTAGLSLANPASSGVAQMIAGNVSIYGVMDQMVWRPDPKGARALGVFLRMMGAPGNRNLVSYSVNGGVTLKAPLPGRDNDALGFGFGLAHLSGSAAAFDRATALFTGAFTPVRTNESFIELTYQAQVSGWWVVQPDLQYVLNPGGGLANPLEPGQRIGNELVLGLRSIMTF